MCMHAVVTCNTAVEPVHFCVSTVTRPVNNDIHLLVATSCFEDTPSSEPEFEVMTNGHAYNPPAAL